jgi:hypothetical protein
MTHSASPNRACIEPAAAWSNVSLPTSSLSQRRIDICHRCSIQAMPRPISQPMTPGIQSSSMKKSAHFGDGERRFHSMVSARFV